MVEALPVLFLPGMHGSAELFGSLCHEVTRQFTPILASFPECGSYSELVSVVEAAVPPHGRFAIVAESFSGPLAIRLAATHCDRVQALILCNSFVVSPRSRLFRFLPWQLIFSLSPPRAAIKLWLVGGGAKPELIVQIKQAIRAVSARTLAKRMVAVLSVNELAALQSVVCPILYLRGAEDRLVPERSAQRVIACAPNARRSDLPGHHLLLQTKPTLAWAVIHRFISETQAG
jgi:pimeloyl-ACP methyl ester carboxylesterase